MDSRFQHTPIGALTFSVGLLVLGSAQANALPKMYWIDTLNGRIEHANLDGTAREALIPTGTATGIAIDAIEGRIYWTGDNPRIGRAFLDGSGVQTLMPQEANPTLAGIAIDTLGRKMYWVDERALPCIHRANLDGSSVESVIVGGMSEPRGIALDPGRAKMYWTDIGTNDIRRASLDGSNVEILVDFPVAIEPLSIALDLFNGKMYWGDSSTERIMRANLDGSNVEEVAVVPSNAPDVWGVGVDRFSERVYWSSEGTVSAISSARLDGTDLQPLISDSASFRGLAIGPIGSVPTVGGVGLAVLAGSLGIAAWIIMRRMRPSHAREGA